MSREVFATGIELESKLFSLNADPTSRGISSFDSSLIAVATKHPPWDMSSSESVPCYSMDDGDENGGITN
eukprot:gene26917-biopygen5776